MNEKKNYLTKLTNELIRVVKANNSFSNLYTLCENNSFSFKSTRNLNDIKKEVDQLRTILNKITSIILNPHVISNQEEIIVRSEISSSLSNQSFKATLKDTKLRKEKESGMSPEYVHSLENNDSFINYENKFIILLINLIDERIKELEVDIFPFIPSLETHFEQQGTSFGKYGIFNNFKNFSYPYEGLFPLPKNTQSKLFKEINKLNKKMKNIKGTNFFKMLSIYHIDNNVLSTNLLLHDDLYNYCYKFYKTIYITNEKNNYEVEYYNYFILSFFNYLASLDVAKTTKSMASTLRISKKDNRLRFDEVSFKRGLFSFFIKEDNANLGVEIEVRLIENAVKSTTRVIKEKKARYYLLSSFNYNIKSKEYIDEVIKNKKNNYNNVILLTMNNHLLKFNDVLTLSFYNLNNDILFNNLISSFTMLFECDSDIYDSVCPVCGRKSVFSSNNGYECYDCHANFALLNVKKQNMLRIKSLRRATNNDAN